MPPLGTHAGGLKGGGVNISNKGSSEAAVQKVPVVEVFLGADPCRKEKGEVREAGLVIWFSSSLSPPEEMGSELFHLENNAGDVAERVHKHRVLVAHC